MDAIDFIRMKYNIPKDKTVVEFLGTTTMPLDLVFRLMEEYKNLKQKGYGRYKEDMGIDIR